MQLLQNLFSKWAILCCTRKLIKQTMKQPSCWLRATKNKQSLYCVTPLPSCWLRYTKFKKWKLPAIVAANVMKLYHSLTFMISTFLRLQAATTSNPNHAPLSLWATGRMIDQDCHSSPLLQKVSLYTQNASCWKNMQRSSTLIPLLAGLAACQSRALRSSITWRFHIIDLQLTLTRILLVAAHMRVTNHWSIIVSSF